MGLLGRIKQLISENEKPAEVTRVMAPLSGEIVPLDTVRVRHNHRWQRGLCLLLK